MRKRTVSFLYRLLVIGSLLSGIVMNLANTSSMLILLSYYTMQSNLLCLVVFIIFLIADLRKYDYREDKWYYIVKGIITIAILVTAIIYMFALLPSGFSMHTISRSKVLTKKIGNLLVHVISPLLVLMDYFLFDKKGKFKIFYPIIWLCFPAYYAFFVYLYQANGGRFYNIGGSRNFAYFFLDYRKIGIKGVAIWILCITIGILLLCYAFVGIDRKLKTKEKKKHKEYFQ